MKQTAPSMGTVMLVSAGTSFGVLLLLGLFVAAWQLWFEPAPLPVLRSFTPAKTIVTPVSAATGPLSCEDETVIPLVKKARSSVVAISLFEQTSSTQIEDDRVGGGSGFFVSEDGLIVTSRHVVEDEKTTYVVVTSNGSVLPAEVVSRDPVLDIAFLRVQGQGFPFLSFGDSDTLEPGQTVVAIGNALDEFRNSVTKGIVSGLNRRLFASDGDATEIIEEAIQTDAAINPGNSGGPLLDLQGRVVGLTTAVSQQGQLISFALPSNVVKRDVEMMVASGTIQRPFLGVRYRLVDDVVKQEYGLSVDYGALIVIASSTHALAISPESPAAKAGLQEHDVILEVNGDPVTEDHSLSARIGKYAVGDTVILSILRDGERKQIFVTLGRFQSL